MPFIKLSHDKSTEPMAPDFFVNVDHVTRIVSRETGATLFLRDGSTVAVEQTPDTIADYVNQIESARSVAKIDLRQK